MKSLLMAIVSVALTSAVVMNAFNQKKQFYPSVVYITKSSPSMAILYLQALVIVILMGKFIRKVFFGQLRPAEMEHLIERSWYAVTETCLAFTVFRDDFSPRFVALFTILLFLKCFHWLAEDRIDYMERSPVISLLFHLRAIGLLVLLATVDGYFVHHAYDNTLIKGPSVQLVFGFEYAILFTVVVHILVKYVLHTIDLTSDHNPWENKAVYLLYTELLLGFFKVILYMMFLIIMMKVHTFPLFVVRPMYLTVREFKKALNDVIMSRRAIHNMNTLYPNATAEELTSGDNVCIICRDEMHSNAKKLPCNHIFHSNCLRSWFQRQQTCPTCRMDVFGATPSRTGAGGVAGMANGQIPQQQRDNNNNRPQQQQQPQNVGPIPQQGQPQDNTSQHQPVNLLPSQQPVGAFNFPGQFTFAPSSLATGIRPMMSIPPFMPSFMPPFMPPPLPPFMGGPFGGMAPQFTCPPPQFSDITGLSQDELLRLEGHERNNIEARIQCLRDIRTLLDAAVIQMNQYVLSVQNISYPRTTRPPFAAPTTLVSNLSDIQNVSSFVSASISNSLINQNASVTNSKQDDLILLLKNPSSLLNTDSNLINKKIDAASNNQTSEATILNKLNSEMETMDSKIVTLDSKVDILDSTVNHSDAEDSKKEYNNKINNLNMEEKKIVTLDNKINILDSTVNNLDAEDSKKEYNNKINNLNMEEKKIVTSEATILNKLNSKMETMDSKIVTLDSKINILDSTVNNSDAKDSEKEYNNKINNLNMEEKAIEKDSSVASTKNGVTEEKKFGNIDNKDTK